MKKLTLEEIGQQRLTAEALEQTARFPVFVLLDNIRSLYNVGSIFRTADAARVEKMFLCGITGRPPRKEIDKTALGAAETVPWEYHPNALEVVSHLKKQGVQIIALEHTSQSVSFWEMDYHFPCCLIIGNEVWGIQEPLLEMVDAAVEIPMYGAKHSLNASVAFGIAVYQMVHHFQKKHQPNR